MEEFRVNYTLQVKYKISLADRSKASEVFER